MLDFVFCTDRNYLKVYGVLMISIMRFMPEAQMRFHVLADTINKADENTLKSIASQHETCEVYFYSTANALSEATLAQIDATLANQSRFTKETYYSLLIAGLLPRDIHRALYLDGDIVCTGSLEELFETDLKGAPVGMCLDIAATESIETYKRLCYPREEGCFNSGVILIDLDIWRKENLTKAMFDYFSQNLSNGLYYDQDIINACLHGRIFQLDFSYNVQPPSLYLYVFPGFQKEKSNHAPDMKYLSKGMWPALCAAVENPRLVHFWWDKPWHKECHNPFCAVWRYFYAKSPWRKVRFKYRDPPSLKKRIKKRIRKLLEKMHLLKPKKRQGVPYPEEVLMSANAILDRLIAEDGKGKV